MPNDEFFPNRMVLAQRYDFVRESSFVLRGTQETSVTAVNCGSSIFLVLFSEFTNLRNIGHHERTDARHIQRLFGQYCPALSQLQARTGEQPKQYALILQCRVFYETP